MGSMKDDSVLWIDELRCSSGSGVSACRICYEQEFESFTTLEAPCACSGTLKFAHRDCIQRWCNEKGNTTCEICLHEFNSGYTTPSEKLRLIHTTDSIIRDNLVVSIEIDDSGEFHSNAASFCRLLALMFIALLLIRHVNGGAQVYPLSLPAVAVLVVKATAILVPAYILIRIISVIRNSFKHQQTNGGS